MLRGRGWLMTIPALVVFSGFLFLVQGSTIWGVGIAHAQNVPALYAFPTSGTAPFQTIFTVTGGNQGDLINFGDGSSATQWSPDAESNSLFVHHTYAIAGTYTAMVDGASASVTVAGVVVPPAPICTMAYNPSTVAPAAPSTLSWTSTNATDVSIPPWGDEWPVNGSLPNVKSGQTITSVGTFTGAGGTATCSATLTVVTAPPPPPTCTMSYSPSTVAPNAPSTLTWTSTNATSANIPPWGGQSVNGSLPNVKTGQTITSVGTFTGVGGTATCSATLTVSNAPPAQDSFSVSAASGASPLSVTFTGTVNANSSCVARMYYLYFADTAPGRVIEVNANTCAPQTFSITHLYATAGTYHPRLYAESLTQLGAGVNNVVYQASVTATGSGVAASVPNPAYDIDPPTVFPSAQSLLPQGVTYTDTVPATLDLAERAAQFISGAAADASRTYDYAPEGAVLSSQSYDTATLSTFYGPQCALGAPCLSFFQGDPNWGKVMLAFGDARDMSGFDRSDAAGTLSTQYQMEENMLNYNTQNFFRTQFNAADIVVPANAAITPTTVAMESLEDEWKDNPTPALTSAINEFVRMHYDWMSTTTDPTGRAFTVLWNLPDPPSGQANINPDGSRVFVAGRALDDLSEWYTLSGNPLALQMANQLDDYLLNYNNSEFWQTTNASLFPPQPGQFVGQTHTWLVAVRGLLDHAVALQKSGTNPALAASENNFANSVYTFIKNRLRVGLVGDFGETGTTGDAIRVGLRLAEAGEGDYYDEIEAWTRNQVAESQIDSAVAAQLQPSSSSVYELNNVASKVQGLFFSDAAHVFAEPYPQTGNTTLNIDGTGNIFRGMYEVWEHIIDINGNTAEVNFLLNRAGEYMDVKSDIPYRGRVEIDTKQSLGPVTDLLVHIPNWTDKTKVQVMTQSSTGATSSVAWSWGGPYGDFAHVSSIKPNTTYVVTFPIVTTTQTITQLENQNQNWNEMDYPDVPDQGGTVIYQGTFRGNTLVGVAASSPTAAPTSGILRYNEPYRQVLLALGNTEVAPPTITVTRFVDDGTSSALPLSAQSVSVAQVAPPTLALALPVLATSTPSVISATSSISTSPLSPSVAAIESLLVELRSLISELESLGVQPSAAAAQLAGPSAPAAPPAASGCPITRTLLPGMSGPDVTVLQQFLYSVYSNFPAPTGYFGPLTEGAVEQWQSDHGVVSSGTPATTGYGAVGTQTRSAMGLCT